MIARSAVRVFRVVGGVLFMILGVIGLFLPFLQGILFLVIGLTLLSTESEKARQWSEYLREHLHRKKKVEGLEGREQ